MQLLTLREQNLFEKIVVLTKPYTFKTGLFIYMGVFNHFISSKKMCLMAVLCFFALTVNAQSERLARANASNGAHLKVEVFPNPTSDYLNIDLSHLELSKPKIEIRSIIGTRMTINLQRNGIKKYKVDVKSFPRGYYLVLVRDDPSKYQQTIRFSKK